MLNCASQNESKYEHMCEFVKTIINGIGENIWEFFCEQNEGNLEFSKYLSVYIFLYNTWIFVYVNEELK